ncbi:unnamed protein product [Periconia digitata]|uniref:Uncharacterized protein n=1 Tax=Periconia digitata TaxID=1303443 RepID=A0A9W4UNH2_9PLEO|nr:unnamed protein product [Periconia digitata]
MAYHDILYIFTCVKPVRNVLLQMLRPFDIANLLAATHSALHPEEKKVYMDYLDDIFDEKRELSRLNELGLNVILFGSDLHILQERLEDPRGHRKKFGKDHDFHIFAIVSKAPSALDKNPTLHMHLQTHRGPKISEDITSNELNTQFPTSMAEDIRLLSKWMFCKPYMAGTRPIRLPGWIPILSTSKNINLRAYMSAADEPDSKWFYMDRLLMSRVFGVREGKLLLGKIDDLQTQCHLLGIENGIKKDISGVFVVNIMSEIINSTVQDLEDSEYFTVVHVIHSSNIAILLRIPFEFCGFREIGELVM